MLRLTERSMGIVSIVMLRTAAPNRKAEGTVRLMMIDYEVKRYVGETGTDLNSLRLCNIGFRVE